MLKVQYIACINEAGFDMYFTIQWLTADGTWHTSQWNSGSYPVGQTRSSPDLASASVGVPTDAISVTPYVHADGGKSVQGTPFVQYEANGQTATYVVKGTTLNFTVTLI